MIRVLIMPDPAYRGSLFDCLTFDLLVLVAPGDDIYAAVSAACEP